MKDELRIYCMAEGFDEENLRARHKADKRIAMLEKRRSEKEERENRRSRKSEEEKAKDVP